MQQTELHLCTLHFVTVNILCLCILQLLYRYVFSILVVEVAKNAAEL
jgi:hypothetical protein